MENMRKYFDIAKEYAGNFGRAAVLTATGLGLLGQGCATQPRFESEKVSKTIETVTSVVGYLERSTGIELSPFENLDFARRSADVNGNGIVEKWEAREYANRVIGLAVLRKKTCEKEDRLEKQYGTRNREHFGPHFTDEQKALIEKTLAEAFQDMDGGK